MIDSGNLQENRLPKIKTSDESEGEKRRREKVKTKTSTKSTNSSVHSQILCCICDENYFKHSVPRLA